MVMEGTEHVPVEESPGQPGMAVPGCGIAHITICHLAAYSTVLLVQMGTETP